MLELRPVSALEKVFLDEAPVARELRICGLRNEGMSWQLAYTLTEASHPLYLAVEVASPIADYVRVRQVRSVPSGMPVYADTDDDYLRKTPGLYPDLLREIGKYDLRAYPQRWDSLWVNVEPRGDLPAGCYPVTIRLRAADGELLAENTQTVELLPGLLPPQRLIHTKWLYADCLAEYYHVPVFSEEHWRIIESFIREAVRGGINMILTPIHTPPLDTRVGGERLTTQLVDVFVENGAYRFGMDKLRRWIDLCRRCGVVYFEMAHLFTQWGAKHAPKIIATVDGTEQRIFGWDTDAAGEAYGAFLRAYIPALRQLFREEGMDDRVWWHISDEPIAEQLPDYLAAKAQVEDLLEDAHVTDALSSFDFYSKGVVAHPVVASNHIEPFLEARVPGLWIYHCCGQHIGVSNLFIAMSSARNRILGMQLYKYGFTGYLQWGFNFYNAQYSDYPIDPYAITDGDGFSPSGDCFQVYPGPGGVPESSIRHEVSRAALQDLRALELLESLGGGDEARGILAEITLTEYPRTGDGFLALRERINDALRKRL